MDWDRLRDRRVLLAAGVGGLALLAALGIGVGAMIRAARHHAPEPMASGAPAASLQVEMGREDNGLDLQRPLRCFAGGQFVGMLTLKDCAQKNGVKTGSLDVGLDPSGEIAAATSDAQVLQQLPEAPPPPESSAEPPAAVGATPAAGTGATIQDACWRYAGDWRKLSDAMSLDECVQALYAGKCARPGSADYGRWGSDTLRLVTGKVERASDAGGFQVLVKQPSGDCTVPHVSE